MVCPFVTKSLVGTREKGEMPKKTALQEAYENALGREVDERTMRRIKNQYLKGKMNLQTVKGLAILRRANGNTQLGIEDIERHQGLIQFASEVEGWVQGSDLLASIRKLKPCPCDRTIRNWGKELDVVLYPDQWYSPQQVQAWICKIARQTRFKFPNSNKRKVS